MNPAVAVAADPGLQLERGALLALLEGRCADPFAILGPHADTASGTTIVRAFVPGCEGIDLIGKDDRLLATMTPIRAPGLAAGLHSGLFAARLREATRYRLRIHWPGATQECEDPYAFGLLLGELDLHLIGEGTHRELGRCLGAQPMTIDGVDGVRFAVWAPNAKRVSVVGDFNSWDGRRHVMRLRRPASGNCSSRASRPAPPTSTKSSVRTACCR